MRREEIKEAWFPKERGHSIGHRSVAVNLPESGKIVIASDTASVLDNLDLMIPSGCCNRAYALEALYKLNAMRREGCLVITGHDTEQWKELKKAPEFYC